jgi:hypothetical protein
VQGGECRTAHALELPHGSATFGAKVKVSPKPVGIAVPLIGADVSPSLVGAAVPLVEHTGLADANGAPVWCELKYTWVVVAVHQRGTVAKSTAEPHARPSAAPAAWQLASEPR